MNRYLKYILIIAGFNIACTLLLYFTDKTLITNLKTSFFLQFFFMTVMIVGMYRLREKETESLDYGERFKFCFTVGYISNLPVYLLTLILYKSDAEFRQLAYNFQIEIAGGLSGIINKLFGQLNKYEIEEKIVHQMIAIGNIENVDLYSVSMVFSELINSFAYYLVISLILALFIASKKMSLKERWRRIDL